MTKMTAGAKPMLRILWGALLIAILMNGWPLARIVSAHASRMETYKSLSFGLPRQDAERVLRRAEIECGFTQDSQDYECIFSDFWRDYTVRVDPRTQTVTYKRMLLRYKSWDLTR